jgi:hypothetical protein
MNTCRIYFNILYTFSSKNMDPFNIDLDALHLLPSGLLASKTGDRHAPATTKQFFVKGPIPLEWLAVAAKLPGKTLHVGLLLWFLKGLRRSSEVPLTSSWLAIFGLEHVTAYRALQALETAGLVTVRRQRGKAPVITLVVS